MRGTSISQTWTWDPSIYAPARYKRACSYDAFLPAPMANEDFLLPTYVAAAISDAEQAILALNTHVQPALAPMARLLLRTESIASSKVEGMQAGVRQIAHAESRRETGASTSATVREVLANIDAMQLAVDEAANAARIGIEHIVEIHRKLMTGAPNPHVAGVVRTAQNWIGGNDYNPCGADFVPPPPAHVIPLLEDLCQVLEDDGLSPLVQAALVHAQFETIHPFDDGNGRTGRALIQVILRRRGIAVEYVPPISVMLASDRDRYIRGLTDFRNGDVLGWLEMFASAAAQGASLATDYLKAVADLMERWRQLLREGASPRSHAAAWAVIDVLPAHPVITAPVAGAATGRAKAAIHQAIRHLTDAGVLEPLSSSKRNRSWEAVGLLDLLEDLEAGRSPTSGREPAGSASSSNRPPARA